MEHYAGIDVSLEFSSVCVVDTTGRIVREGKMASEPEALIGWLRGLGLELVRVGLEAGPLSQWLYAAMRCIKGWLISTIWPNQFGPASAHQGHPPAVCVCALPALPVRRLQYLGPADALTSGFGIAPDLKRDRLVQLVET